jgi:hypothetical protein
MDILKKVTKTETVLKSTDQSLKSGLKKVAEQAGAESAKKELESVIQKK